MCLPGDYNAGCAFPDSRTFLRISRSCLIGPVRDLAVLLVHVLATVARLAGPGGVRAVVAESLLLILNRSGTSCPVGTR